MSRLDEAAISYGTVIIVTAINSEIIRLYTVVYGPSNALIQYKPTLGNLWLYKQ